VPSAWQPRGNKTVLKGSERRWEAPQLKSCYQWLKEDYSTMKGQLLQRHDVGPRQSEGPKDLGDLRSVPERAGSGFCIRSQKYFGAWPCWARVNKSRTLHWTREVIGSQCSIGTLSGKPEPPIIEKRLCFHQLLPPFPQYFSFLPKISDKSTPVQCRTSVMKVELRE